MSKTFIGEANRHAGLYSLLPPRGYAFKIEGVDPAFLQMPFGRQTEEWAKIREWQKDARKNWISTQPRKGQKTVTELKRWLKSVQPSEFFASWDLSVDDDSLLILYKTTTATSFQNESIFQR